LVAQETHDRIFKSGYGIVASNKCFVDKPCRQGIFFVENVTLYVRVARVPIVSLQQLFGNMLLEAPGGEDACIALPRIRVARGQTTEMQVEVRSDRQIQRVIHGT
jgi:hypothetical protein